MKFDASVIVNSLPLLMQGVWLTIVLVLVSLAIGIIIGLVVCAGMMLGQGLVRWLSATYVSLFRTLPETVLIFWLFYCLPLILDSRPTAFQSAVVALAIPSGAFLAEIFRGGILAVPLSQKEAARAIGLSAFWIAWDVVFPQATRVMIAPFLGFVTILIKNSALVSVIGVEELFYKATVYAGETQTYLEVLTAAALLYFVIIFPLSLAVQFQERKFQRGNS